MGHFAPPDLSQTSVRPNMYQEMAAGPSSTTDPTGEIKNPGTRIPDTRARQRDKPPSGMACRASRVACRPRTSFRGEPSFYFAPQDTYRMSGVGRRKLPRNRIFPSPHHLHPLGTSRHEHSFPSLMRWPLDISRGLGS